ncbi:corticotropin-releasing diuretic hormone 44 [Cotesia typhae]|uniref:corticotropin-releasing diuretic hormone 44 n=1 Tax=Cotesia typhae TaxID=2053667 RepID=UPI003D686D04
MFLMRLLSVTTLITLSKSTPLSYLTHQRRDAPTDGGGRDDDDGVYVPYIIDERGFYWPQDENLKVNDSVSGIDRGKRIHSLSVTNSLDVLRDRVLLELARRKAQQEKIQIDANRHYLDNIGKRSNQYIKMDLPQIFEPKNIKIPRIFDHQLIGDQSEFNYYTAKNPLPLDSTLTNLDWYNNLNDVSQYNLNDQIRKIKKNNKIRLL